jgi:uncharacterized membrane protein
MANHRKNNVRTPKTATHTSQIFQNNPAEQPEDASPEYDVVPGYEGLKWMSYGLIAAISLGLAFGFNGDYFVKTWHDISKICDFSLLDEWAVFTAPVLLFLLLLILVLLWMMASHYEFELWRRWIRHPSRTETVAPFFVFPVVLGILPAYPNKIVFLSGFLAVYSLSNYWTQWLCNEFFRRTLQNTRAIPLSKAKSEALAVMEHYWLKRPQLARIATTMFFICIAFSLALAGHVQPEPQRHRFQLAAYAMLIVVLASSEFTILCWRLKRNQDIQKIENMPLKDTKHPPYAE